MSWDKDIEELRRREALAEKMGGEDRVARQKASGKLTARERVDALLDKGSFHETGKIAGKAAYGVDNELASFRATPFVVGRGDDSRRPLRRRQSRHRLAHDFDFAGVRLQQGAGREQQRCLAAPARSPDGGEVARAERQRDAVHGRDAAGDHGVGLADFCELQQHRLFSLQNDGRILSRRDERRHPTGRGGECDGDNRRNRDGGPQGR